MWLKTFKNQLKVSKECEEITVFDIIPSVYCAAECLGSGPTFLRYTNTNTGAPSSQSRPPDAWLIVLTSQRQLQLAAASSYPGDTLPPLCFDYRLDRWSILMYCTFKSNPSLLITHFLSLIVNMWSVAEA